MAAIIVVALICFLLWMHTEARRLNSAASVNCYLVNDEAQRMMWQGTMFPVPTHLLQPKFRSLEVWADGVPNVFTGEYQPVLDEVTASSLTPVQLAGRTIVSQETGPRGPHIIVKVMDRNGTMTTLESCVDAFFYKQRHRA